MVGLGAGIVNCIGPRKTVAALAKHELPSTTLETHRAFVPQLRQLMVFDEFAREIGTTNLVFVLAPHADVESYGAFGQYLAAARSLEEAFARARAAMPFHSSQDRVSLRRDRTGYWFTYHAAVRHAVGYTHYATLAVSVILSIARPFTGDARPRHIELNVPKPRDAGTYEDHFGCPVLFDCKELAICFHPDSPGLRNRLGRQNPVTIGDVVRDARGPAPNDLIGAVEALLRADLSSEAKIGRVAAQLDLSERTLRRRLDERGHSFREILQRTRIKTAGELLADTDLDIADISRRVGYEHPSHFGRAFRRLTGHAPSVARLSPGATDLAEYGYRDR